MSLDYNCYMCKDEGCSNCRSLETAYDPKTELEFRGRIASLEGQISEKVHELQKNKYSREIRPGVFVDVYDVLKAFEVTDGAIAHALKKLLAPGKRGHKDYLHDLNDVLVSVNRAIDMHKEWNN